MATISAVGSAASVAVQAQLPQSPAKPEPAEKKQETASDGPHYFSPVVNVDPNTGLAVLVVRDSQTGDEISQYPSKQAVDEYAKTQKSTDGTQQNPAAMTQAAE